MSSFQFGGQHLTAAIFALGLIIIRTLNDNIILRSLETERDRTQSKCFAFSHTRLMYNDGTTLQDGTHELLVFKVNKCE